MKRLVSIGLAAAALAFGLGGVAQAQSDRAVERSGNTFHVKVCPEHGRPDVARCHAHIVTDANGRAHPAGRPVAGAQYSAAQLRAAYNIPWITGQQTPNGPVVAVVDAFGYANAERDLGVYRSQNGLPPCTTANGCFTKVNQTGGTSYPAENTGWAQETALDIQMVSAICPNCRILLVQATDNGFDNLAAAVDYAAAHAIAVSNSYGGSESGSAPYEFHYNHPGVAITVSSGDNGYGVEFPASSPHVTAVGGTSLYMSGGAYDSESAWSGAGSGCSTVFAKPQWQSIVPTCTKRMVADVSAVADPNTGVLVYAPTNGTTSNWYVFGGTSVAAPIIAGVYGVNGGASNYGSDPYNGGTLHDVTSGSNGRCKPAPNFYCNAQGGYDGPTGLGTPNGPSAF